MNTFYIKRNDKLFGPLTVSQIACCLSRNIFTPEDLFSRDRVNWHKLESFIADESATPPAEAANPPPVPPMKLFATNTLPEADMPMPEQRPCYSDVPVPAIAKPPSNPPFVAFWKNYGVVHGRATRSEYWVPNLFNSAILVVLVSCGFGLLEADVPRLLTDQGYSVLAMAAIYLAAIIIPAWTVSIRRLHDLNRSGWLLLAIFIPFIGLLFSLFFQLLFCFEGTKGQNKYGPEPTTTLTR